MTSVLRSPILILEPNIAGSAFNIAPERAQELADEVAVQRFALAVTDDKGFSFRVNTQTHEAKLPIAAMEYVWCTAYVCWLLYQECVQAQAAKADSIDLAATDVISSAIDLLKWSAENLAHPGAVPWPAGPKPTAPMGGTVAVDVANELFLAGLAWILHHEIAHVRLNHGQVHGALSVQQEKECDLSATQWIVEKCTDPAALQKRQLGIVVALMAMQYLDEPEGTDTYVGSHPPSVERLDDCLGAANADDDGLMCAFAGVALQMQLTQLKMQAPLDGDSIRDIFSGFLVRYRTEGR